METLVFLDTETTGLDLEHDRLIELCWCFNKEPNKFISHRFKPPVSISHSAMAVHHITNEDLEKCPVFKGSETCKLFQENLPSWTCCGHNVDYDLKMLSNEGLPQPKNKIDTIQVCRYLFPDLEQYSLQFLRYKFELNKKETTEILPHTAESDVKVLQLLFDHLKEELMRTKGSNGDVVKEMIRITKEPLLLTKMPFGKWKGTLFSEIPHSYLKWAKDNIQDKNVVYSLQHYLS
jgi:exodeoxyribonuclease X